MYKAVLRRAVEKGEVRRDIDLDAAALFIDNAVIMLQFSLTSRYYQPVSYTHLDVYKRQLPSRRFWRSVTMPSIRKVI